MWLEIHWRVDAVICERHNATASIDAERLHMFTFTCTAKSQEHSNTHSQRICNSHTHTHNTHDPRHIYSVSVLISCVEETSFSRIKNVRRLLMFFVQSFSRDCVLPINFIMPSIWICYAYCYTCNTICGYWMSEQSARVFDFRIVSMKQQATTNPTYKWRTLPWCIAINFPIYMCFALYILCISVECVATFGSKQVLNGSNDGSSGRYLSYYTATAHQRLVSTSLVYLYYDSSQKL